MFNNCRDEGFHFRRERVVSLAEACLFSWHTPFSAEGRLPTGWLDKLYQIKDRLFIRPSTQLATRSNRYTVIYHGCSKLVSESLYTRVEILEPNAANSG